MASREAAGSRGELLELAAERLAGGKAGGGGSNCEPATDGWALASVGHMTCLQLILSSRLPARCPVRLNHAIHAAPPPQSLVRSCPSPDCEQMIT